MTIQSDLVTGARLLAENAALRDRLDVAVRTAQESAHAVQILATRIRVADNYLLTAADDTPIDALRTDLRGLLTGTTREPGRD